MLVRAARGTVQNIGCWWIKDENPSRRLHETTMKCQYNDDEEDQGAAVLEETESVMEAGSNNKYTNNRDDVDAALNKQRADAWNSAFNYVVEVDHQSSDFSESSMDDDKEKTKTMQETQESLGIATSPSPDLVPMDGGSNNWEGDTVLLAAVPVDEISEEHHVSTTFHEEVTAVPVSDNKEDESPTGISLIFRNRQVFCIVVLLVIVSVSLAAGLLASDSTKQRNDSKEEAPSDSTAPPSVPPTAVQSLYWDEVDSFDALDDDPDKRYKLSMSGDGTVLAVSPRPRGIARFFLRNDGSRWIENVNLRLNRTDNDSLGSDVSLSNDGKRVAFGSNGYNAFNFSDGKVEIYELNDSTGFWKTPQVIYGDMDLEESGYSVALSKDGLTLAVGVPYRTYNSSDLYALGHVRVYRWDDEASSFQQVYGVDGEEYCDFAGGSVALSGDGSVLAIGSPSTCGGTGNVRVFYYDQEEETWKQRGKTIYGKGNTWFGFTIDLSDDGNYVAAGAVKGLYSKVFQWKDDNNTDGGGNGNWKQVGQALRGDGFDFGVKVSLSIRSSSSSSPSCNAASAILLAVSDATSVYTYRLGLMSNGDDDDDDQKWQMIGVLPGGEVSLSSCCGRTIGVVGRFDPGVTIYDELETASCGTGNRQ
eukprot:scaffold1431_cov76-Cylindrotheca_fusiformis.AAC.1